MTMKKNFIKGQIRHIGGVLRANGEAGQKLMTKFLHFIVREDRLAQCLRKQIKQKSQIFNQCRGHEIRSYGLPHQIPNSRQLIQVHYRDYQSCASPCRASTPKP